jgi:hypothetical protein
MMNDLDHETHTIDFDLEIHTPPHYEPPKPPEPSYSPSAPLISSIQNWRNSAPKFSLLEKPTPFDEEAINAEFQEEYEKLEQRGRQLNLKFQEFVKDLQIWICSSVEPVNQEAKLRQNPYVFTIDV